MTYLRRYLRYRQIPFAFHREAGLVWAELVSRGAAIRDEPLYGDARAVARAMMERARHNVALLVPRLRELGYRFAEPDAVWRPPDPATLEALDRLERDYGPLPLALRAWFEVVGSVNLMGAHPRLSSHAELDWGGSERADGDPLVVESVLVVELGGLPYRDAEDLPYGGLYEVPFAPDVAHKAGESGGGPLCLLAPNPAFDAPVIDPEGRWTGTFFVRHLQTCFDWGGFPGLRGGWYPEQAWHPAGSEAEFDFLRRDLLPLL